MNCVYHWTTISEEKKLSLLRKLKEAHETDHDNFTSILLRLMHKADAENTRRFMKAWPDEMSVVHVWRTGLVKADYTL